MLELLIKGLRRIFCFLICKNHKYVEKGRTVWHHNFTMSSEGPITPEEWDEISYKCKICGKEIQRYENYRDYKPEEV